jgi:hypothetical protein
MAFKKSDEPAKTVRPMPSGVPAYRVNVWVRVTGVASAADAEQKVIDLLYPLPWVAGVRSTTEDREKS